MPAEISLLLAFSPWAVLLAGLLDLLVGDPAWLPHPVRWIGQGAFALEHALRRLPVPERPLGMVFTVLVLTGTGLLVGGSLYGAAKIHPYVAFVIQVLWLHFGIATRDLSKALTRIHQPLMAGNLEEARIKVSWIVSRNTAQLDEAGICRSGIESGAENTVDAIVAPWFWALVGGPLGLWLFKAASTLDSQVGYKTPRHLRFGWASARLDDVLNWLPARLAFVPFSLAGFIVATGMNVNSRINVLMRALRIALRDRNLHASPNSGIGEAWMAGYLGVRLMGPNYYHGALCDKPWLGAEFPDAHAQHLGLTRVWVLACGVVCFLLTFLLVWLLS